MSLHDSHEDDEDNIANYYGIAPGIVGVLIGAALVVFMFALADGFS